MFEDPLIYICRQCPKWYILMQFTGLNDKAGKPVFGNYDVLSRTFDDASEHLRTIELVWSRNSRYGFLWSTSRAIVAERDGIDNRYEITGNVLEAPELLAG